MLRADGVVKLSDLGLLKKLESSYGMTKPGVSAILSRKSKFRSFMSLLIRAAKPEDSEEAAKVLQQSIRKLCAADHCNDEETIAEWTSNKTPDNIRRWFSNPELWCVVAESNSRIAGVGMMSKSGEIRLLYVSPSVRYSGVSSKMLIYLEGQALNQGIQEVFLNSSETAKSFYESRGYRPNGEPIKGFGKAFGFPMVKSLMS